MFRAVPGPLPTPDTRDVGGVTLPQGRLVTNDRGVAVAWIGTETLKEERLAGLIRGLAAAFSRTGLWPLLVPRSTRATGLDVPWGATGPEQPKPEIPEALAVYERICRNHVIHNADYEPPAPPVTTLAAPRPGPQLTPDELTIRKDGGLLLVLVARPADVPAALGWIGATNAQATGADISAVLRSWEDRFGATLVSLGFDTVEVQLGNRPESVEQRNVLAAEHFWICPDSFEGFTLDDYSRALSTTTRWSFWWD
ncbi:MAG TPA: DUF4253 domain-containing protein [Vicinamibacterales bacterium]|jgi:hypothetical protein|nr:DUF4253 domain-containing protein [Vicinamibacterales bacterium]